MAEIGLFPVFMAKRSAYNTPFLGILVSFGGTMLLYFVNLTTNIWAANFLSSRGMLLEFASFLWLRHKFSTLSRPYRVPVGIPSLIVIIAAPVALLIFIMNLTNLVICTLNISVTVAGVSGQFFMKACKKRNWMEFVVTRHIGVQILVSDRTEEQVETNGNVHDQA